MQTNNCRKLSTKRLCTFSTDTSCQLEILRHDSNYKNDKHNVKFEFKLNFKPYRNSFDVENNFCQTTNFQLCLWKKKKKNWKFFTKDQIRLDNIWNGWSLNRKNGSFSEEDFYLHLQIFLIGYQLICFVFFFFFTFLFHSTLLKLNSNAKLFQFRSRSRVEFSYFKEFNIFLLQFFFLILFLSRSSLIGVLVNCFKVN